MTVVTGRRAVVTGGASGLGFAIARRLRSEGASVALLDRDGSGLARAAGELGEPIVTLQADVSSPDAVRSAIAHAADALGGIDTLIVSAGVLHIKPHDQVTEDDWDQTLDVNLKGAFFSIQAAAPHLSASGRGRVVVIASVGGRRGYPHIQAYCASKFGLIGLVESFAAELASGLTTVNCVCPGSVPTTQMGRQVVQSKANTTGKSPRDITAAVARSNPSGRVATEADVAAAVLFFVSTEASFITGQALTVDGGAHTGVLPGLSEQPIGAVT